MRSVIVSTIRGASSTRKVVWRIGGRRKTWITSRLRAKSLAKQYDAYRPFPDLAINGQQTLSENIADLAGLAVALEAYHFSLQSTPAPMRDGFTGDQRFFIAFAQSWREKHREAELRNLVTTDGHAPEQYRAATVRNLDAWYAAFSVTPNQKMYLAPKHRVRIW